VYFVQLNLGVCSREVVGVFVRFHCAASSGVVFVVVSSSSGLVVASSCVGFWNAVSKGVRYELGTGADCCSIAALMMSLQQSRSV
jgi:hypothetical protein